MTRYQNARDGQRTGQPWTDEENAILTAMRREGHTHAEIGAALGRTSFAVTRRRAVLRLPVKSPRKPADRHEFFPHLDMECDTWFGVFGRDGWDHMTHRERLAAVAGLRAAGWYQREICDRFGLVHWGDSLRHIVRELLRTIPTRRTAVA